MHEKGKKKKPARLMGRKRKRADHKRFEIFIATETNKNLTWVLSG